MAHDLFANELKGRIASARARAAHAAALQHRGLKGMVREIVLQDLIVPLLPPRFRATSGVVVDHVGNQSKQIDIVIYDTECLPALFYDTAQTVGAVPVEACQYAIEVKSTSTRHEIRDAVAKGKSVAALEPLWEATNNGVPLHWPITGLFAFGSNLKRTQRGELDRIIDEIRGEPTVHFNPSPNMVLLRPPVAIGCVAGFGYLAHDGVSRWQTVQADSNDLEVMVFVTSIINTLLKAPPPPRLPFGYYALGTSQPEQFTEAIRQLASRVGEFDANDALSAGLQARQSVRPLGSVVGNASELMPAIDRLVNEGVLQALPRQAGGPLRWRSLVSPIKDAGPPSA